MAAFHLHLNGFDEHAKRERGKKLIQFRNNGPITIAIIIFLASIYSTGKEA